MKWEDVDVGEPKCGEIKIKIKAIGVNYIDVYMRKGVLPSLCPPLPFTPGVFGFFSLVAFYCKHQFKIVVSSE